MSYSSVPMTDHGFTPASRARESAARHGVWSSMADESLDSLSSPSPDAALAHLSLGAENSCLVVGANGEAGWRTAPGIKRLVREHFVAGRPLAIAMEYAVASIEDTLATVPRRVYGIVVESTDRYVRAIADAAGLSNAECALHRDAVEHVFERMSAVALGRPPSFEGLPAEPQFAAALLVVRELMHHLNISSIGLRGTSGPASRR